ncbi:MAG: DUF58 domain-containing protein [Burkholderiales bacterium]|nr:DUF58 domain-containing protein [Burkholderiales bacterium]
MSRAAVSWIERIAMRLPGRAGPHHPSLVLAQRNVFILPSRAGLLYALVLLSMLIASINYSLSMGFLLTFLLAGVAIVSMLHTFRNLSALELRAGRSEPVFAGALAELQVTLKERRGNERFAIRISVPGAAAPEWVDTLALAEQPARVVWPAPTRGLMPLPKIRLSTEYPLGLWRAWAWWQPAGEVLVYPHPEHPRAPLPGSTLAASEGNGSGAGEEDLASLRAYVPGDSPRRVAWKAVARTGSDDLLVKQFDGAARGELLLDWQAMPASMDGESRLSRLTAWVLEADSAGLRWALRLPGLAMPVDGGGAHRDRCLEALALARI